LNYGGLGHGGQVSIERQGRYQNFKARAMTATRDSSIFFSLRYCKRYLLICSGSALPSNITVWAEKVFFDSNISSFLTGGS